MPEIKHQFTGGKMNKDLDERLVPNGEYRHAENIQVSTSEGSAVGTVQNILGNSLVSGQDFYQMSDKICVGSIADESNDKMYYFVTGKNALVNGDFSKNPNNDDNNEFSLGSGWSWNGKSMIAKDASEFQKLNKNIPTGYFASGDKCIVSFTVSNYIEGKINLQYLNENGKGFYINSFTPQNKTYSFEVTIGDYTSSSNNFFNRFWIQTSSNSTFSGQIDNLCMSTGSDIIMQYDSISGQAKPVVIDVNKNCLKFLAVNTITSINVLDGMIFWTDNIHEPKKINIQRCLDGFNGNNSQTNFINKETNGSWPIEEKHITVIKKKPSTPPVIKLVTERDHPTKIYTGVMRITSAPAVPFEKNQDNEFNNSSMWVSANNYYNTHYDFSSINVGSTFLTDIETDISGNSGFTLDWKRLDTIVFKEYGGENYDQPPSVPITNYTIKAKITGWGWNDFTDQQSVLTLNSSLAMPNNTGDQPLHWYIFNNSSSSNTNPSTYEYNEDNPENSKIIVDHPGDWQKIYGNLDLNIVEGASYRLTYEIADYINGNVQVAVCVPGSIFDASYTNTWKFNDPSYKNADGEYEFNFQASELNGNDEGSYRPTAENKIQIQFQDSIAGVSFKGSIVNVKLERTDISEARVQCEVIEVNGTPPVVPQNMSEIRFAVDKFDVKQRIFEFKFPRIAYRYRYQDGEYSAISPFSQPAFLPGSFDYSPSKGNNIGMVNRITSIEVSGLINQDIPNGVQAIDIIYKEDSMPNLYVVDTIKPNHNPLTGNSNSWNEDLYIIESEQVNQSVETNQLLRPWDNVPKTALAQEITGNRIVYGNYKQNYDLKRYSDKKDYTPIFDVDTVGSEIQGFETKTSIKSKREYQVGAVFLDEYGRETSVISNKTGVSKIPKSQANKQNKISVKFDDASYPIDFKYVKFFIKETSGEYYNLAMDRFYDAEDDQTWLSFPSSDRNKISIDDFIILKKGLETSFLVEDDTEYKVLDIQDQAPEFIRNRKIKIAEITRTQSENVFGSGMSEAPRQGVDEFKLNYQFFSDGSSSHIHELKEEVHIDFHDTLTGNTSKRYEVAALSTDFAVGSSTPTLADSKYSFKLIKPLGEDVNFISDDPSGAFPTEIRQGVSVRLYKYIPKLSAQFDGRFFVKVNNDLGVTENIIKSSSLAIGSSSFYRTAASKKIALRKSDHYSRNGSKWTGMVHGVYGDENDYSNPHFTWQNDLPMWGMGPDAAFTRNYNQFSDTWKMAEPILSNSSPVTYLNVGQYAFGEHKVNDVKPDWSFEFAYLTGGRTVIRGTNNSWYKDYAAGKVMPNSSLANTNGFSNYNSGSDWQELVNSEKLKKADSHGWGGSKRAQNAVWYINQGPIKNARWSSNINTTLSGVSMNGYNLSSQSGISSNGNWQLNLGGIYHSYWMGNRSTNNYQKNHYIQNFWNVGKKGGNSFYDNSFMIDFVSKLSGGSVIRWREDPSKEIYTVQKIHNQFGWLTWRGNYVGSPNVVLDPNNPAFTTHDETDFFRINDSGDGSGVHGEDANWEHAAGQLSPNMSQQYQLICKNSSGGFSLPWNPVGSLGPITNGLELSITASAQGDIVGEPRVFVNSIYATDQNGDTKTITEGLILCSHSDGGVGNVYNGSDGTYSTPPWAIKDKQELLIYKITPPTSNGGNYTLHLTGYRRPLTYNSSSVKDTAGHDFVDNKPANGGVMVFKQPTMNGYTQFSCNRINAQAKEWSGIVNVGPYDVTTDASNIVDQYIPLIMPVVYTLEFLEEVDFESDLPSNPAVWETEPKENTPLDIYYEASGYNPLLLNNETKHISIPTSSLVSSAEDGGSFDDNTAVTSVSKSGIFNNIWYIKLNKNYRSGVIGINNYINSGEKIKIDKPDGSSITLVFMGNTSSIDSDGNHVMETRDSASDYIYVSENLYNAEYSLSWHNCFSFGNGVESNRIRDGFNKPFVSNGAKASTTLKEYKENNMTSGLIYSGIYNNNSGTNNLNQFIAAEKITKDLSPIYGSIQKLHSRSTADGDLIALCEDRILKILANKDALYNADGNTNITSTNNVLGTATPYSGNFGISKNPESFSSESYRIYFADKVRGAVLRLSKDGLTPISDAGMKDWFRDNLKNNSKIIGSYDDKKDEYNITLPNTNTTVSFREDVRGWVSFKSFVIESGVSSSNEYYTFKNGKAFKHHDKTVDRNTFHEEDLKPSVLEVVLNDSPELIKNFHTLNYSGEKDWSVSKIYTNKQEGSISEFIEKEGRWSNYIKGIDADLDSNSDFGALNVQGIGEVESIDIDNKTIHFSGSVNSSLQTGDVLYRKQNLEKISNVVSVYSNKVKVNSLGNVSDGDYVFFAKNNIANVSSLLGYYASAIFENNSTDKTEIFSVGSEITQSSK